MLPLVGLSLVVLPVLVQLLQCLPFLLDVSEDVESLSVQHLDVFFQHYWPVFFIQFDVHIPIWVKLYFFTVFW